ncbi:hypothetical protein, partial [Nonomuraea lactucae]|uniref:hypothetical protein n=1 Tax=Nonomuraea lactucae TaxID=2249762 RepID=UPI0013B3E80C
LDRLADADPGSADEAAAHSRDWNTAGSPRADRIASDLAARSPGPDNALRAGFYGVAAQEIADRLAALGTPPGGTSTSGTSPGGTSTTGPNGTAPDGAGRPRTVPAQQIRNSLFEPGRRRPAHHSPVTVAEVQAAVTSDLDLSDFGGEVLSLSWPDPSSLMVVETRAHGPLHYRIEIGRVSPGNVAESEIRTGSSGDPIVMRIAPRTANESLYRAVVHDISHGGQTRAAAAAGSAQGVLRRWVSRTRPIEGRDECVVPRLNEFRFLSRKWRAASSMDEKNRWAHEIERLLADLSERGQTPPLPPWSGGQHLAAVAPSAPGTPLSDLTSYIQHTIDSLSRTEGGLHLRMGAKLATAAAAERQAEERLEDYDKAMGQRDRGAKERARKAMAEAEKSLATQERHLRIARAYEDAHGYAGHAREAYEELLAALRQGTTPDPGALDALADQARSWLTDFQEALRLALPALAAQPSFVPADRLPHLNRLTLTLNDLMEERGIDHTFTADALDRTLRAEFSRVVSGEGALLGVGQRKPGEVLVQLSVTDLVEVLDSTKVASEIMNGVLPQGGRTVGATANFRRGGTAGVKLHRWFAALPPGELTEFLKQFELSVSFDAEMRRSLTGNAGRAGLDGGVEDNRGESTPFDAQATWKVRVRTSVGQGWSPEVTVAYGTHDDAASLRTYVSHAYMEPPPLREARLPEDERGRTPFPEHVVLGLTGLIKLADDTARALGDRHFPPGSVARRQLYTAMIDDLYSRMRQAVDDPRGVRRIINVGGRPFAHLQIKAVPRLRTATRVGPASRYHWQERLRVDVSSATGGESSGRSRGVSVSTGYVGFAPFDAVPGEDEYAAKAGPNGRAGTGAAASDGLSVNGVTYHPSVQRYTGHTQGVELEFDFEVTARLIDDDEVLAPIKGSGKGLFRFPESDAHKYGLPVDAQALTFDPDGRPVFRDDPDPDPPEGRRGELPSFYGNEPGRLRGAGPALVQGIEEAEKLRAATEAKLREKGILAPLVNGEPAYSSDPLERLSQLVNEREIAEQLSAQRLQSGYDQAVQGGLLVDLVVRRHGRAPRHVTLRITLDQHFTDGEGNPRSTFAGTTDAQAVVNLDIGSDTNVWSHSRTENLGYGGGAGIKHHLPENTEGISPNLGVGGGRDGSRTLSHTTGLTINGVKLTESTSPVAIFDIPHTARVDLLDGDGNTEPLAELEGSARVLISSDLLPEIDAPPPGTWSPTPDEVMRYATVQHLDSRNLQDVARAMLPTLSSADSPAFHHLAEFLNVRSLVAHPELFRTPYGTDLAVRPQGASPRTGSIAVRGTPGQSMLVGVTDDVGGIINLTLSSMGVTSERSSGGKVEASLGTAAQHADGAGEGGKAGGNHSGGGSRSRNDLSIWGRERLAIETGKKYVFLASVGFDVTGGESGALPVQRTADGTMLYTVPERHALRLYAEGTLDLPVHQVADAVERFLDGNLKLDRGVAVPLAKRYLSELPQATAPVPNADRHTPMALINALKPLVDAGSALTRVDDFLTRAAELVTAAREVELPSFFMHAMGVTLVDDIRLQRDGEDVELLDAVRDAVASAAPAALADPAIPDSLRKIFAENRWWGLIDNIISDEGARLRYHTPFDELGRREQIVVSVRAEFTDEPAVLLESTDEVGSIVQDYTYEEHGRSETRSATNAVSTAGDAAAEGHGDNGGVGTDRARSATGSSSEQETRLQRFARFRGMDRVRQGVRLVIEVERTPQRARASGLDTKAGPATTAPVELTGHMVRLVPSGFTRPAGTLPAEPARTLDPRQVPLVHSYFVSSVRANLYRAVVDALSKRKLLGDDVHLVETELLNLLSATAATTLFERMTGEQGHTMRLPVDGLRNRVVDLRIKASQFGLQVLARGIEGVEIGQVWRIQRTTGSATGGGMAFPIGGGTGVDDASTGLGLGVSGGEQSSAGVTDAGGNRREMSLFETDSAVIVQLTAGYDLTVVRQALTPEGPKRQGDPVHLPGAATGEVIAVMSESDFEAMVAVIESGGNLGPEWQLVGPSQAAARPSRTERADPARPWGSLMDARVRSRLLGEHVRVEVREPDGATHVYHASPDGTLRCENDDLGFAAAFATLSPELAGLADRSGLHLRQVFENPRTQVGFPDRVRTELSAQGVDVSTADATVWPVRRPGGESASGTPSSGGRAQGS